MQTNPLITNYPNYYIKYFIYYPTTSRTATSGAGHGIVRAVNLAQEMVSKNLKTSDQFGQVT